MNNCHGTCIPVLPDAMGMSTYEFIVKRRREESVTGDNSSGSGKSEAPRSFLWRCMSGICCFCCSVKLRRTRRIADQNPSAESTRVVSLSVNNGISKSAMNSNSTSMDAPESTCDNDSINYKTAGYYNEENDSRPDHNGIISLANQTGNHGDVYLGSPHRILQDQLKKNHPSSDVLTREQNSITCEPDFDNHKTQNILTKKNSNLSLNGPEAMHQSDPSQSTNRRDSLDTVSRNSVVDLDCVPGMHFQQSPANSEHSNSFHRFNQANLHRNGRFSRLSFITSGSLDAEEGRKVSEATPKMQRKTSRNMKQQQLLFRQKSIEQLIHKERVLKNSLSLDSGPESPKDRFFRQNSVCHPSERQFSPQKIQDIKARNIDHFTLKEHSSY